MQFLKGAILPYVSEDWYSPSHVWRLIIRLEFELRVEKTKITKKKCKKEKRKKKIRVVNGNAMICITNIKQKQ